MESRLDVTQSSLGPQAAPRPSAPWQARGAAALPPSMCSALWAPLCRTPRGRAPPCWPCSPVCSLSSGHTGHLPGLRLLQPSSRLTSLLHGPGSLRSLGSPWHPSEVASPRLWGTAPWVILALFLCELVCCMSCLWRCVWPVEEGRRRIGSGLSPPTISLCFSGAQFLRVCCGLRVCSSPCMCHIEIHALEKSRVRATEGQTGSAPERRQGQKPEGRGSETCKYLGTESPGQRA